MASFTESATLLLNDKASKNVDKVNASLKRLFATANKMKNMRMKLNLDDKGISKAKQFEKTVASLQKTARKPIRLKVEAPNLKSVEAQLNRLARKRTTTINAKMAGGNQGLAGSLRGINWRGFGSQIGFGFRASIGNALFRGAGNVAREGGQATISAEAAALRTQQAGFSPAETTDLVAMSREVQAKFSQVPAADILNSSVEMLSTIKAAGGSVADMRAAMERVAANSQRMAITFGNAAQGAEESRNLEKIASLKGLGVNDKTIKQLQDEALRSIISAGGDLTGADAVRVGRQLKPANLISLDPGAFGDILSLRDEGGASSTADVRTFLNDLKRTSLSRKNRDLMAAAGIRNKDRTAGAISAAAQKNPVQAAIDLLGPMVAKELNKTGKDLNTASIDEIANVLTERFGFTTTGANLPSQAIAQQENIRQQRIARGQANLDPTLAAKTFRGSTQAFVSSFDTAVARNLDKFAPVFAEGMQPVQQAIDLAGKQAETGNFSRAADTMLKAGTNLLRGPAGDVIQGLAIADAVKTLLTPGADPMAKAAALLEVGAVALADAAASIIGWFGGQDTTKQPTGFDHLGNPIRQPDVGGGPIETMVGMISDAQKNVSFALDFVGKTVSLAISPITAVVDVASSALTGLANAANSVTGVFKNWGFNDPKDPGSSGKFIFNPNTGFKSDAGTRPDQLIGRMLDVEQRTDEMTKIMRLEKTDALKTNALKATGGVVPVEVMNPEKIRITANELQSFMAAMNKTKAALGFPTEAAQFDQRNAPAQVEEGANTIQRAFGLGGADAASKITTAGDTLPPKGTAFGTSAAAAINPSGMGAAFGAAAAAAIRNAAASIKVNVNQSKVGSAPADAGAHVGGPL